jgi:ATP-dependent protease ClpP protease subunit
VKLDPEKGIMYISGAINTETTEMVTCLLHSVWEDKFKNGLYVYINSGGGGVENSLAIYDILTHYKETHGNKLTTVVFGQCESGAVIIYLAGKKRYAYPHSMFFFHDVQCTLVGCTGSNLPANANYVSDSRELIKQLHKGKLKKGAIDKIGGFKDERYLNAQQALEVGLVTNIVENSANPYPAYKYGTTDKTNRNRVSK